MNISDVKSVILNAKRSPVRSLPNSFEERSKLYDESHNLLVNVREAKNFLERDLTVKEVYDPRYTLMELTGIESRLRSRLEFLINWLISQELKTFFGSDLPFQNLEKVRKLSEELEEKFHLTLYCEKPKGRTLVKEFAFLIEKVYWNFYKLEDETYGLLDKFITGREESPFPPFEITRQYLEVPKGFKGKFRDLAMEEEKARSKITEFLSDRRVKSFYRSLPTIEVDFKLPNREIVRNCRYSPDEVMAFVISVLEPTVFGWTDYCKRKNQNGKVEFLAFKKTLSSSSRIVVDKTSKPGSKYIANKCIIPLTILLKKCFKCSDECKHKHHPSVYRRIADLFNACGMPGSQGKEGWDSEQIEKRYGRIRKTPGFNEEWWWEYYKDQLAFYSNSHKETGLVDLIKKMADG